MICHGKVRLPERNFKKIAPTSVRGLTGNIRHTISNLANPKFVNSLPDTSGKRKQEQQNSAT